MVKELYDFSKEIADEISWGTGVLRGSFNPIFESICPRSLFSVYSDGIMQLNYAWINKTDQEKEYQKKYKELLSKFFTLPEDDGTARYPAVSIEMLKDNINEFMEDIKTFISN